MPRGPSARHLASVIFLFPLLPYGRHKIISQSFLAEAFIYEYNRTF